MIIVTLKYKLTHIDDNNVNKNKLPISAKV